MDRGAWWAAGVAWSCKESDTTERLSLSLLNRGHAFLMLQPIIMMSRQPRFSIEQAAITYRIQSCSGKLKFLQAGLLRKSEK